MAYKNKNKAEIKKRATGNCAPSPLAGGEPSPPYRDGHAITFGYPRK